jgi:probable F420-dependent oxidoreductase
MLEPFTTLSFLAAETATIRLGTAICLVPQRNPVYTAKEAAAVDWLSGGRLDFGVGVGWLKEEFEALGVPFERRGARTAEYLEVIRRLWCDELSEFEGAFYTLPPSRQYPKPVQSPHPPIHFGGESEAALRRVADLGQGWHGYNLGPDAAAERIQRLEALLQMRGRQREEIEITVSAYLHPVDAASLARYAEAGVDQVTVMTLARQIEQMSAQLDGFVESALRPAERL